MVNGTTSALQSQLLTLMAQGQIPQSNSFAQSLATWKRDFSPKQESCAMEMVRKASQPKAPVAPGLTLDVSKIVEMFKFARHALKRPKITLVLDTANPNQLVRIAYDEKRGVMWLNSQSFGYNYGLITIADGSIKLKKYGHDNRAQLLAVLGEFAKDPITLAISHGRLTGNCMFCQLKLSDERSLHEGYGKRCARHWGRPWGDRPNLSAVTHWSLGDEK